MKTSAALLAFTCLIMISSAGMAAEQNGDPSEFGGENYGVQPIDGPHSHRKEAVEVKAADAVQTPAQSAALLNSHSQP